MSTIGVGVVGLGYFGERHLAALASIPNVEVRAVSSRSRQRADELRRRFDIGTYYEDYVALANDPRVDVVDVVNEEHRHIGVTLAALQAGKHVFCEKPIATRLEEVDQMIEAAQKADRILMPGHILRFDVRHVHVKELVQSGRLGRLSSFYGRRNISKAALMTYNQRTSPLLNASLHDVDLARWYFGEKARDIYCVVNSAAGANVPDTHWTVLRFDSGAIAVFETVQLGPQQMPVWVDAYLELIGTEGTVKIDSTHQGTEAWGNERVEWVDTHHWPDYRGVGAGALTEELRYFFDCVIKGQKPTVVTPEDAREDIRLGLLAMESAKTGQVVKC